MQKLISKYGLAAHLALVAVAPLFLSPTAVLWLSLVAAIWLIMEPSRIGNERLHTARKRVASAIFKDSFFWISLFLLVVAVIRFLNTGVALSYDAETSKWFISSAVFPLLPGSVSGTGYSLVGCAAAVVVIVQGCRHGLGRSARGAFALVASLISGLGGFVWTILCHDGAKVAVEAVECLPTNPTYSGCVYGVYLVLAIVALGTAFEHRWLRAMPLTVVGISGNLLGLFLFSPAAVAVAFAVVALIIFSYAFVLLRLQIARVAEFKFLVFFGFAISLSVLTALGLLPQSVIDARIAPFLTGSFIPDGFIEARTALSDISARVWRLNPWLGGGLGSYAIELQFNATASDWAIVSPLQKAVPNGYWMLLSERGVIGAFFLAVPVVMLIFDYAMHLVRGVALTIPNALSWAGLVLFIVAGLEMLVDVSFLSPAAIVSLAGVLSISSNAFPKELRANVR